MAGALTRQRAAVARLISLVEAGGEAIPAVMALLHPHTGGAYTVGITGAPGAGKSTLTEQLIRRLRREGHDVGVLAVDPSSPFSGGALLGDRIRMQDHAADPGVFIRSMATRGHLGGLAAATRRATKVLDAAGMAWILVETVGVGQVELDVAGTADTTVVVVNPGWGDGVQAAKAGLLEIADVFVVNKADRDGADKTVRDLQLMLELAPHQAWRPPIIPMVALRGDGTDDLWDALAAHRAFLESAGGLAARRARRTREELRAIVFERLHARADAACSGEQFDELAEQVSAQAVDPYTAAEALLADAFVRLTSYGGGEGHRDNH